VTFNVMIRCVQRTEPPPASSNALHAHSLSRGLRGTDWSLGGLALVVELGGVAGEGSVLGGRVRRRRQALPSTYMRGCGRGQHTPHVDTLQRQH